jgi:hypothetical protein
MKHRKVRQLVSIAAAGVFAALGTTPAVAGPSSDVVIIGGTTLDTNVPCNYSLATDANTMWSSGGGCLTLPAGINFTPMPPADVSTANLTAGAFDTAVLNVASFAMACNTNTLTTQAQADLVSFVSSGHKLIIYDSECSPQDYSWLPYSFTTSNPGAQGAQGTVAVVENNPLSTWVGDPDCTGAGGASPLCINTQLLGSSTDAAGDANVVTTNNANLCADMAGTNILGDQGTSHVYMKYPDPALGPGLIIYNGFDQDYQTFASPGGAILAQIWDQELSTPLITSLSDAAALPCGTPVVGIALTPATAVNEVGTDHTVTATLTDLFTQPQPDIEVTFTVTNGPNKDASGDCTDNTDCTTDSDGQVSFSYTGAGGVGTDTIEACFTNDAEDEICATATKDWVITNQPPVCSDAYPSPDLLWPPNHKFVPIEIMGVTDPDGDDVTLTVTSIRQDEAVDAIGSGNTAPDGQGVGTDTAQVRAERIGDPKVPGNGRVYYIGFEASDGKASCQGKVQVGVPHDQGKGSTPIGDGEIYDSTAQP